MGRILATDWRVCPARSSTMAAGIADTLWSMEDVAALSEAKAPAKRGRRRRIMALDNFQATAVVSASVGFPRRRGYLTLEELRKAISGRRQLECRFH